MLPDRTPNRCGTCGAEWYTTHTCPMQTSVTPQMIDMVRVASQDPMALRDAEDPSRPALVRGDGMKVMDLTFIEDEVRRVQVAEDMYLVWDHIDRPQGVAGYRDDDLRWDHLCEVIPDPVEGEVRKRIAAFLSPGHRISSADPITIEGSLLCLSCKLHGFVREGQWVAA